MAVTVLPVQNNPFIFLLLNFSLLDFILLKEGKVKGDSVRLAGFGTFEVCTRAERTGRNPRTGEAMKFPASKVPKFKAGKTLKDAAK